MRCSGRVDEGAMAAQCPRVGARGPNVFVSSPNVAAVYVDN